MQKPYTETKKCKLCGDSFAVTSVYGNPYQWCKKCRVKKSEKMKKLAEKVMKK